MDTTAYASAMDELLRDEDKAQAMGQAGLRLVSERYDFEGYITSLEQPFAEVISERLPASQRAIPQLPARDRTSRLFVPVPATLRPRRFQPPATPCDASQSRLGLSAPALARPAAAAGLALRRARGAGAEAGIDIAVSLSALVLLSPLLIIVALLIRLDGGPAFFSRRRVGLLGSHFGMFKFRSMCVDAEARLRPCSAQSEKAGASPSR